MSNFSFKKSLTRTISFLLAIVVCFTVVSCFSGCGKSNEEEKKEQLVDFQKVVQNDKEFTVNNYVFCNDKIYYYEQNLDVPVLCSAYLDGSNKKEIVSSEKLKSSSLFFKNGDFIYLYCYANNNIQKININNGSFSVVNNSGFIQLMQPFVFNNDYILLNQKNNEKGIIAKMDLKTDKISNKRNVDGDITGPVFFDCSDDSLYWISLDKKDKTIRNIVKNGEIKFTYKDNVERSRNEIFVKDNLLFVKTNEKICKFDKNTFKIISENKIPSDYVLIPSYPTDIKTFRGGQVSLNIATYPLFTRLSDDDCVIYVFDSDRMEMKKTIKSQASGCYCRNIDDYCIIQTYKETMVYKISSGNYKRYSSVYSSIDGTDIYMMGYKDTGKEKRIYSPQKFSLIDLL